MKLLKAINTILPRLGEHTVTSVDAKHPTVAIILNAIATALDTVLLEDWWFNSYETELLPDSEGHIVIGDDILKVRLTDSPGIVTRREGRLYSMATRTYKWPVGQAVRVFIAERLTFENLPESAAQYVMYAGLVEAYLTDVGMEAITQEWSKAASRARQGMTAEHLQNKKYSIRNGGRYQRIRAHMRG